MSDSVRPHRRQPTRLPRPWDSSDKNTGVWKEAETLVICKFKSMFRRPRSHKSFSTWKRLSLNGTLKIIHWNINFVWKNESRQSCLTLCNPMDYIVHRILQARILEWVAFLFSRRFSQHRDWTQASHIAGGFFTSWATREALCLEISISKMNVCETCISVWAKGMRNEEGNFQNDCYSRWSNDS